MIEEAAEPIEISGVYRSLEDFLARATARIDLVLLDLHLPGLGGSEGVRAVRERGHHVLVVSASDSPDIVVAAIAAGAEGYLTKDADAPEIIRAVSVITAGGTYVSPTLASHLLAVERRKGPSRGTGPGYCRATVHQHLHGALPPRPHQRQDRPPPPPRPDPARSRNRLDRSPRRPLNPWGARPSAEHLTLGFCLRRLCSFASPARTPPDARRPLMRSASWPCRPAWSNWPVSPTRAHGPALFRL
jgi:CheY-like chemotaxis protein